MFHVLPRIFWLFTALLSLYGSQLRADCARCAKIEQERAKEQAAKPKPSTYYDDQVQLHPSDEQNLMAESELSDGKGLGELKGASVRSSSTHSEGLPAKDRERSTKSADSFSDFDKQERQLINYIAEAEPFLSSQRKSSYASLLAVIKTKDLLETLDGAFTLLIPTDEAIKQLPSGTLEELMKPENSNQLSQLISNHLIPKKLLKEDFVKLNNKDVKAISGKSLTLTITNGHLTVGNARVLLIEPGGYDGVILVIDRVLQ